MIQFWALFSKNWTTYLKYKGLIEIYKPIIKILSKLLINRISYLVINKIFKNYANMPGIFKLCLMKIYGSIQNLSPPDNNSGKMYRTD